MTTGWRYVWNPNSAWNGFLITEPGNVLSDPDGAQCFGGPRDGERRVVTSEVIAWGLFVHRSATGVVNGEYRLVRQMQSHANEAVSEIGERHNDAAGERDANDGGASAR